MKLDFQEIKSMNFKEILILYIHFHLETFIKNVYMPIIIIFFFFWGGGAKNLKDIAGILFLC